MTSFTGSQIHGHMSDQRENQFEPGKPEQFCVPLHGLGDGAYPSLGVTPYPMAWRLAIVQDEEHRGFEYVR